MESFLSLEMFCCVEGEAYYPFLLIEFFTFMFLYSLFHPSKWKLQVIYCPHEDYLLHDKPETTNLAKWRKGIHHTI